MAFCSSKQGCPHLTAFSFILHLFFSPTKLCLSQMTRIGNCSLVFYTVLTICGISVFGSTRWKICLENSNIWYIFPLPQIITYYCMVELCLFASLRSKCLKKRQSFFQETARESVKHYYMRKAKTM